MRKQTLVAVLIGLTTTANADPAFDIGRASRNTIDPSRFNYDIPPHSANYDDPLRPQFHFTPVQGHMADTTGLIFHEGTYHLFHMFDQWERRRYKHKQWGHATSRDLIHWQQVDPILDTVRDHKPGSGCGIVDFNNSSGLQQGDGKTLLVFYTDYESGTCVSFSRDAGKTWQYYEKNPVLPGADDKRDPLVIWHAPSRKWSMVRYEKKGMAFYQSDTLVDWTPTGRLEGFYECPDLFELPVEGSEGKRWVLVDGNGSYFVGQFDGRMFHPESDRQRVIYGDAYATQTWKFPDAAPVQVAWMPYPLNEITQTLNWHGQMTFPCTLALRRSGEGSIRLCREPVAALDGIRDSGREFTKRDFTVDSTGNPLKDIPMDVQEIDLNIGAVNADGFVLKIGAAQIKYLASERKLACEGVEAKVPGEGKGIHLRVLVDRPSIEIFAEDGQVTISRVLFQSLSSDRELSLAAAGAGTLDVRNLRVTPLKSIWPR
ncbi:glycoside hydrolase family 32 protein [Luteolibacter soli]|uniref:Glycoside hydrolase family 32 protein n=1 Tax=Luteolibacter soli TaxID=3135280 RepID=A0ABU9AT15_9BACT